MPKMGGGEANVSAFGRAVSELSRSSVIGREPPKRLLERLKDHNQMYGRCLPSGFEALRGVDMMTSPGLSGPGGPRWERRPGSPAALRKRSLRGRG